jgi:hypothetical protein
VFMRIYDRPGEREGRLVPVETPEREYVPIGDGWAAPKDPKLSFGREGTWPHHPGLEGVILKFGIRGGHVACIGIETEEDGPELTSSLLKKVASAVTTWSRFWSLGSLVRLVEADDGEVIGESAMRHRSLFPADATTGWEQYLDPEAIEKYERGRTGPGRPALPDEFLQEVARLYVEAGRLTLPRRSYIAQHFPGYSPAAINNWIRKARLAGFLGEAPGPRLAGEKPKSKPKSRTKRER